MSSGLTFKLEMFQHVIRILLLQTIITIPVQSAGMCTTDLVVVGLQGNIIQNGGVCSKTMRPQVYFTIKCLDNIRSRCSPSSNIIEVDVCSSKQPLTKEMRVSMSSNNDKDATLSIDLTLLAKYGEELKILDKFPIHTNLYSTEDTVTHVEAIGRRHQTRVQVTFHRTCIKSVLRGTSSNVHDRSRNRDNSTSGVIETVSSSNHSNDSLPYKDDYDVSGDVDLEGFPRAVFSEHPRHVTKIPSQERVYPTVKFIQIPLNARKSEKSLSEKNKQFIPDTTSHIENLSNKITISSSFSPELQHTKISKDAITNINIPILKENRKDGFDGNSNIRNVYSRLTKSSSSSTSDFQHDGMSRNTRNTINIPVLTGHREDRLEADSNIGTLHSRQLKSSSSSETSMLPRDMDSKRIIYPYTDRKVLNRIDKLQASANSKTVVQVKTVMENKPSENMMEELVNPSINKKASNASPETPKLSEFYQRFMKSLNEQNDKKVRTTVNSVSVDDVKLELADDSKYGTEKPPKDIKLPLNKTGEHSIMKNIELNKRNTKHSLLNYNNESKPLSGKTKSPLIETSTKAENTEELKSDYLNLLEKRKLLKPSQYKQRMKLMAISSKTTVTPKTNTTSKNISENDTKQATDTEHQPLIDVADTEFISNQESGMLKQTTLETRQMTHSSNSNISQTFDSKAEKERNENIPVKTELNNLEERNFMNESSDFEKSNSSFTENSNITSTTTTTTPKDDVSKVSLSTLTTLTVSDSIKSKENMSIEYIQSNSEEEERTNSTQSSVRLVSTVSNTNDITKIPFVRTTITKNTSTSNSVYNIDDTTESHYVKNTTENTSLSDSVSNTDAITEPPFVKNTSLSDSVSNTDAITEPPFVKNTPSEFTILKNSTTKITSISSSDHSEKAEPPANGITETPVVEANTTKVDISATTLPSTHQSSISSSPGTIFEKTSITFPTTSTPSSTSTDDNLSSTRNIAQSMSTVPFNTTTQPVIQTQTRTQSTMSTDDNLSSTGNIAQSMSTVPSKRTTQPVIYTQTRTPKPTKLLTETTHTMITTLLQTTATTDVANQTMGNPPDQTVGETTSTETIIVGTTESLLAAKSTHKMSISAGSDVGSDDTFWPIVAALVIGIPSVIVFAIAITVIHKRRKIDTSRAFYLRGGSHRASIDV